MTDFIKYQDLKFIKSFDLDFNQTTSLMILKITFTGKDVILEMDRNCLFTGECDNFIKKEIDKYLYIREKKLNRILK